MLTRSPSSFSRPPSSIFATLCMMIVVPSLLTTSVAGAFAVWWRLDWLLFAQLGLFGGVGFFGIVALMFAAWGLAALSRQVEELQEEKVYPVPQPSELRLVPVQGARLVDGVPEQDLRWFVKHICVHGHSQRASLGRKTPSGRVVDAEAWAEFSAPLRRLGIIHGVKPRSAGVLAEQDPEVILARLGLN